MKTFGLLAVIAALSGMGCLGGAGTEETQQVADFELSAEDSKAMADANNSFAVDLYKRLASEEDNLFFSPLSISTALAMTYAGARGETARQMEEVLHFALDQERLHPAAASLIASFQAAKDDSGYELSVANALWGQQDYQFLEEFLNLVQTHYRAGLNKVDFEKNAEGARQEINAWVEKETRDKIKDLIQPGVLDQMTRLVLTNAIYFKGEWAVKFNAEATRDLPFTRLDGSRITTPLMHHSGDYAYLETETFQAVELPYKGEEVSMFLFLPKKHDGLPAFEASLSIENLNEWLGSMHSRNIDTLALPKFKMTCEFELAGLLKSLGMHDAFSEDDADFSGMTGNRALFISDVIHKAFVEVNEEGTEAAAATGVVMRVTGIRKPLVFKADRPFLFLIRDNATENILFIGRVMQPETNAG